MKIQATSDKHTISSPLTIRTVFIYSVLAVIIACAAIMLNYKHSANPTWSVPFFSGAANWQFGQGWMHCEDGIRNFSSLPTAEAREEYRFSASPSNKLKPYALQTRGFMYISVIARNMFFWMGDVKAVKWLQICVHITITLLVISRLKRTSDKGLFLLLYGLNPVIISFVTTAHYYYWQTVPAAVVVLYLLDKNLKLRYFSFAVAFGLAFLYLVRPTIVLVPILLFVLVAKRESKWIGISSIVIYIVCAMWLFGGNNHEKDPFFAACCGVSAYPNPYMDGLGDEAGWHFFEIQTGQKMQSKITSIDGNFHQDPEFRKKTREVFREGYFRILRERPLMLVRNAALNFFQSFFLGYCTNSRLLSYLSSFCGLLVFTALLWKKQYWFLAAIALSSLTFVPYMYPHQGYIFGSLILLVVAFIKVLGELPLYCKWAGSDGI